MNIKTIIEKQSDINSFRSVEGFLRQWESTEPFSSGRPKNAGELKYWGWLVTGRSITKTGIEIENELVSFAEEEFGVLYEFDDFNNKVEDLNIPYIQMIRL